MPVPNSFTFISVDYCEQRFSISTTLKSYEYESAFDGSNITNSTVQLYAHDYFNFLLRFEGEQSIIALTVYDAQEQKAILQLNKLLFFRLCWLLLVH